MKRYIRVWILHAIIALPMAVLCGCSIPGRGRDVLFQASVMDSLSRGVYDGKMTFGQLRRHGDMGIGTFNALDGEMVAVDGGFYQVKSDGKAYPVADYLRSPFAVVTFLDPEKTASLVEEVDYGELRGHLDSLIVDEKIPHAIRVDGFFTYAKVRSVPSQRKPYLPLTEALEGQVVFEHRGVKGIMVGFRCPAYMEGVNVPGYHFHFITEDRKAGGHLLDCRVSGARVTVDRTPGIHIVLED